MYTKKGGGNKKRPPPLTLAYSTLNPPEHESGVLGSETDRTLPHRDADSAAQTWPATPAAFPAGVQQDVVPSTASLNAQGATSSGLGLLSNRMTPNLDQQHSHGYSVQQQQTQSRGDDSTQRFAASRAPSEVSPLIDSHPSLKRRLTMLDDESIWRANQRDAVTAPLHIYLEGPTTKRLRLDTQDVVMDDIDNIEQEQGRSEHDNRLPGQRRKRPPPLLPQSLKVTRDFVTSNPQRSPLPTPVPLPCSYRTTHLSEPPRRLLQVVGSDGTTAKRPVAIRIDRYEYEGHHVRGPSTTIPFDSSNWRNQRRFRLLDAFLKDPALFHVLLGYLSIPSLIDLYAISKPFHYYFNCHATASILASVRVIAPDADRIFPWRCYKHLCIKDPVRRQQARAQAQERPAMKPVDFSRDVPSLRWLQMVTWREGVCQDMLDQLKRQGLQLPPDVNEALKRVWFLMDLPRNTLRAACIHDATYFSPRMLFLAASFFMKVDMAFTDPSFALYPPPNHPQAGLFPPTWAGGAHIGCSLRETLLRERHLTPLWRTLRGWSWHESSRALPPCRLDALRLWIRHFGNRDDVPPGSEIATLLLRLGITRDSVGAAGRERKTRHSPHPASAQTPLPPRLLPFDQLILGECVRRHLPLHTRLPSVMLWGFVDSHNCNVPLPS